MLKGGAKVEGRLEAAEIRFTAKKVSDLKYDEKLFDVLRIERKKIADSKHIPPYVVFPDKTLIELAAYYPWTSDDLSRIHGIGSAKLKSYGGNFLRILKNYYAANNIQRTRLEPLRHKRHSQTGKLLKYQIVGEAYNSGIPVEEILSRFSMKFETMLRHLIRYNEEIPVNPERLNSFVECAEEKQKEVFNLFDEMGYFYLRPVYDSLEEEVSFTDLHILRFIYIHSQGRE